MTNTATATSTGTVKLLRVLKTTPEKLYKAFIDPDAMVKWFPPYGFTGKVHSINAKVGGECKMSFTNFGTGQGHSFTTKYVTLKPFELIEYTDRFDDASLAGEMKCKISFRKVSVGTELTIVQEGIPAVIPSDACYLGWQESLKQLARLVEPEIP